MKIKYLDHLLLLMIIGTICFSCEKGELGEGDSYGGFYVTGSGLSESAMTVKYNDSIIGTLSAGATSGVGKTTGSYKNQFLTGEGVLALYKEDNLVADTTITLLKDSTLNFNAIYSDELGIYGFFNPQKGPSDSLYIQLRYIDNTASLSFSSLTFEFFNSSSVQDNTTLIVPAFAIKEKEYSNIFVLPLATFPANYCNPFYIRITDANGNRLKIYSKRSKKDIEVYSWSSTSFEGSHFVYTTATIDVDVNPLTTGGTGYNVTLSRKEL